MGLLGSLLGGALGLAADVTGAAINAGVEAHNEQKLQQQIAENAEMLDQYIHSCVSLGQESVLKTNRQLYKDGLSETIEEIIDILISMKGFHHFYMGVMKNDGDLSEVYRYVENIYRDIFLAQQQYAVDGTMKVYFEEAKKELIFKAKNKITDMLEMNRGVIGNLNKSVNFTLAVSLLCLVEIVSEDSEYHAAVEALHRYQKSARLIFTSLHPIEHGEFELDDPQTINIDKVQSTISYVETHVSDNSTGYFEGILNNLNADFLYALGLQVWYYAGLTPFNQAMFDQAGDSLNEYKTPTGNDLERVLAEVYVKNKLGGETLVMQNIDEIMEKASVRNPIYARALCSFLAWIECYQVELEVLKKAVQEKIQLTPDMLERLEFLSKGGTVNKVKIYDVPDRTDQFVFDSSTEDIDASGLDAFFDALQRKRKKLNYSLLLQKWTKTLPLPREKVFSPETLDAEFNELMVDFDNEIMYQVSNASAVNLTNLSYQNCALFYFTTERNRGITMLFDCEKFGRNLNISILTLFTPDNDMGDDMAKYAKAIPNSRYTESFRESILQALDISLKDKTDLYGSQTHTNTNSLFE